MLRFDRKQQNSVKQLSFQKKIFLSKKKKKNKKTFKTPRERMKKQEILYLLIYFLWPSYVFPQHIVYQPIRAHHEAL